MSNDPAADILASVRAVVEERDALRARVAELETLTCRQSTVLAHAADLLHELDAFAAAVCEEPAPERSRATTDVPLAPGTRLVTVSLGDLVTVSLGDEEPAPEPAIAQAARRAAAAKAKSKVQRFSLADGKRWLAAMQDGATVRSLANLEECATKTIRLWVERAGGKIVDGRLAEETEPEITVDDDEADAPPFLLHSHASDAASAASS